MTIKKKTKKTKPKSKKITTVTKRKRKKSSKKTIAPAQAKPKSIADGVNDSSRVTKLKLYMVGKGITQKILADKTHLSSHSINRLVNSGKGNKSTIELVSTKLGLTFNQLNELLVMSEPVQMPADAPARNVEL